MNEEKKVSKLKALILGIASTIIFLIVKCFDNSSSRSLKFIQHCFNLGMFKSLAIILVILILTLIGLLLLMSYKEDNFLFLKLAFITIAVIFMVFPIHSMGCIYACVLSGASLFVTYEFWYIILFSKKFSISQIISIFALIVPYLYVFFRL